MDNYKLATAQRLRFQTNKGLLSTEQLWDLSPEELDTLAVSLEREYKKADKKSFLAKVSEKDKTAKLKFDVALDILNTKVAELEEAAQRMEDKKYNEKLLNLISEKQDDALKGLSIKQLEARLRG